MSSVEEKPYTCSACGQRHNGNHTAEDCPEAPNKPTREHDYYVIIETPDSIMTVYGPYTKEEAKRKYVDRHTALTKTSSDARVSLGRKAPAENQHWEYGSRSDVVDPPSFDTQIIDTDKEEFDYE